MQLNSLGRRIQMLRESNMMTKTDLAQVLGVTRKELVDWEEGRAVPKAEQIVELARYFSVDPRSLVEDPAEAAQTQARIEAEQKTVSGKKLVLAVFGLIVGLVILAGSVLVLYSMGAAGDLQESAAKSEEAAPLPEYLALEEVELVGLCTDICVVSNALIIKAMHPDIPVRVDARCCAGVTPESHGAALKTMAMCQIDVIGG